MTLQKLSFIGGALLWCLSAAADVWHVDKDNEEGPWDGRSWATAFDEIQPAIDAAYAAGGGEVWVTRDYYDEPRTSIVHPAPYDLNTGSVVMREGVHLYGGFDGDETARSQRPHVGETTIKGYVVEGVFGHVIVGADNSTLDGFTIRGGWAYRHGEYDSDNPRLRGGGMYNDGVSPVIRNCVFKDNTAWGGGGAMKNMRGACPTILNCVFEDNECDLGAGIDNEEDASPTITGCRFVRNDADWGWGGGIRNRYGSSPTVTDCVFEGNVAGAAAGMGNSDDSAPVLEDCVFVENVAQGGGMAAGQSRTPGNRPSWRRAADSSETCTTTSIRGVRATGGAPCATPTTAPPCSRIVCFSPIDPGAAGPCAMWAIRSSGSSIARSSKTWPPTCMGGKESETRIGPT